MASVYTDTLDLARAGKCDEAHELIQSYSDEYGCLIHGYLHRVEGDPGNARYWYRRAGATMPDNTLDEELDRLAALVASA